MATFNFSFAPGTTLQQMVGFETAGRIWSSYLTDNVTINIHAGVSSDLTGNVIGGALPGIRASQSYDSIKSALIADATSADDRTATNALPNNQITARFDLINTNGSNNQVEAQSKTLNLTTADAKAMGLALPNGGTGLDGVIVFGSLSGGSYSWNYDYTRSSTAPVNSLDFLSTAIHEIGHVLGFVSGVDKPGWLDSTVLDATQQSLYKEQLKTQILYTTPLDLFRDSALTLNKDRLDLSYGSKGGAKYFSIDGKTAITQFSTGKNTSLGGDGSQASHWKNEGIMDPGLAPGVRETISMLDLRAMDVIGWNLAPNATTLKLDLSALAGQSQQALASRLNQNVTWLNANATTAAQSLSQDRSQDIITMVENSEIYNWGTTRLNPYRQVIDMMSRQEVYTSFQTTTSMCSCTICHQSAQTSLSDALGSSAFKTNGWLGGKLDNFGQSGTSETIDPSAARLIRKFVHAIALNEPGLSQIATKLTPSVSANPSLLEFSGGQLSGTQTRVSPVQPGQQPFDWERSHSYDSLVRRYDGSSQQAGSFESIEQFLDNLQLLK